MKNPLTFRVESSLGAVFISMLSLFFIGLIFIFMKNLESDIDIMSANDGPIKSISRADILRIKRWTDQNNIDIPEGEGYRYILRKYPDKPWLEE